MTKEQFIELVSTALTETNPDEIRRVFNAEQVNYNAIERMGQIVLAIDAAFEASTPYLSQGARAFASALYNRIGEYMAQYGLDISRISAEIIMGIVIALLVKLSVIAVAEQQAGIE